ncbi:MAG: DUF1800 family protein [Pseudomonadota bacterium]
MVEVRPAARFARAVLSTFMLLALAACGGGGTDEGTIAPPPVGNPPPDPTPTPNPPPTVSYSLIETEAEAQRFLSTATFGGTSSDIAALVGQDAADWLAAEFAKPATNYLDRVIPLITQRLDEPFNARATRPVHSDMFWEATISGNDQLRQRALFALSQIVVVGEFSLNRSHQHAAYMDALYLNAFGNYRDLLDDITYNPSMGDYLTYRGSQRANANTGRLPDENYAREILQLFTIGLIELNMDGTPALQNGQTVETFDNDDIVNLSRVFTGMNFDRTRNPEWLMWAVPMAHFANRHSPESKEFLGVSIPENTDGPTSIDLALDGIFAHDNVPPFIARQLIQRFTMSSPPPAYVERVATAFATGSFTADNGATFGTGNRGDMQATLAAVLLDELMFADTVDGKLREPVLRFVHLIRAMETENINVAAENRLRDSGDTGTSLGQHPFRPPSVFNFYRPGYVAPNTESGERGLTAPELQIVNGASSIGYINFVGDYIFNRTPNGGTNAFEPNYAPFVALADDGDALVTYVDSLLTGGRLPQQDFDEFASIVDAMPLRSGQTDSDLRKRAQTALYLVATSATFAVVQ